MTLKLFVFSFFLFFSATTAFAVPVEGFDGFNWGADRKDVVQIRGEDSVNWGDIVIWGAKEDETVSRFSIKLVGYEFKESCSEANEQPSQSCDLWGGTYLLTTTSQTDIDTLTQLLSKKYGEYKVSNAVELKKSPESGELLSKIGVSRHTWRQEDASAVVLFYKSYDRDHFDENKEVSKGLFRIGVSYYSSDYMKDKDMKRRQEKSF